MAIASLLFKKSTVIFNLVYSTTGEKKKLLKLVQLQNSLVLNTHRSIQTSYMKTFSSATTPDLQSVFPLDLFNSRG